MKKISLIFLVILIPFLLKAQIRLELDGSINKKFSFLIGNTSFTIAEGTSVTIKSIYNLNGAIEVQVFDNDKNMMFLTSMSNLSSISFKPINIKTVLAKTSTKS